MQQISATVVLTVPEDKIIIEKEEYLRLKQCETYGETGDLKWFAQRVGMSEKNAKDRILIPFSKELEQIVRYPIKNGEHWKFHKTKVLEWLERNWQRYTR